MDLQVDLNVLREQREKFEKDLYYDAIETLIGELDQDEVNKITAMNNLNLKIQTMLSIIQHQSDTVKQRDLLNKFKDFLHKDYYWLYDLFKQNKNSSYVRDVLSVGGVPVLPERNVSRTEILTKVRSSIVSLAKSDRRFLVLHGLIGCGKSSLATEALYDSSLLSHFSDGVYWVMVGSDGKDKIRSLQEELNVRLKEHDPDLSANSKIALIQLRQRYLETKPNCLIILDDVHSEDVVKFLDVGVNFIITTRDMNVIKDNRSISNFIKVPDHFTQAESLQLFAMSLNVRKDDLPNVPVRTILKLCKGLPINVAVISAELADHQEDLRTDSSERWSHYINILQTNRNLNEYSYQYINKAISLAVENLSDRLKKCFYHFVVFREDVNLRPEVLATVWGISKIRAENIMTEFVKKSLLGRYWNKTLSSYVYGVHDLFLDYLRTVLPQDTIKSYHRNLLESYKFHFPDWTSKLPKNDNYIYYYLGYHLMAADLKQHFTLIYTDLEFLEAKLQAVEPFDLILDFSRYSDQIENGMNKMEIKALKEFIEQYGPAIHKGMDIAQLALQESPDSYVHKMGKVLAKKRNKTDKKCYIEFPHHQIEKGDWIPRVINMRDKKVTAVCFAHSTHIVIAMKGGYLELWNMKCIRLRNFVGHLGDITYITTNNEQTRLFSCSKDKTIRVWNLELDKNIEENYDLSPERTQLSYYDFWPSVTKGVDAIKEIEFPRPAIWVAHYYNKISAICCNDSEKSTELHLYNNYRHFETFEFPGLRVCEFSGDGQFIIAGGDSGVHIISLDDLSVKTPINHPTIGLSILHNGTMGGLVTVSRDRVDFWGDQTIAAFEKHHFEKKIEEQGAKYSLFHIGHHIALVTEKNDILILDSDTGCTLQFISGSNIEKITAIAVKKGMLLTAFSDNRVEIKPIEIVDVPISKIFWPSSQNFPIVTKVEKAVKIKVVCDNRTKYCYTAKDPVNNLASTCPVEDEIHIVYSTSWGEVCLINTKLQEVCKLDDFKFTCPTTILKLFQHEDKRLVAASTTQDHLMVLDITKTPHKMYIFGKDVKGITSCYLTCTGEIIFSTKDSVQVWDLGTCNSLYVLEDAKLIAIHEGKSLILISQDMKISLRKSSTDEEIWKYSINCDLASFSPDGQILALVSRRQLLVVDILCLSPHVYELPNFMRCHSYNSLAVTDSRIACISTNQPCIFIASPNGPLASAAVQLSSLIAFNDSFAAIDKSGTLHMLQLVDFNDTP
ncbi:apoptotic protease-activating factor 1-like isoform X2 [Cimex lectularius]|uniref:Apoptotic protease-activating factor 1 n=1 Tax=Cimex lectularius TaxID=79782 RepID=A0A8I6RWA7_CIMLE|nr:apoptotic protease-activating factor 1-like isoform X2 [Cimex lectularius]